MTEEKELTQEEMDAAFAAGFNRAQGIEPEVVKEADAEKPQPETEAEQTTEPATAESAGTEGEQEQEAETESAATDAEVKEEPKPVGLDEAKANELIAARLNAYRQEQQQNERKLFGKLGNLEAAIKRLSDRPSVGNRKAVDDAISKLSSDYPDIGERMKEVVNALGTAPADEKPDATVFDPALLQAQTADLVMRERAELEQKLNKETSDLHLAIIADRHPDFKDHMKPDSGFAKWFRTLPQEKQTEYGNSRNGFVVSRALSEYKDAVAKQRKAQEDKKKRLASAVNPKTTDTPPAKGISDEEAFMRGFKKAQGIS